MIKIVLRTAERKHVVTLAIPPFVTPPEVLIWGQRYFRHEAEAGPVDTDVPPVYTEAFAYVAPIGCELDLHPSDSA